MLVITHIFTVKTHYKLKNATSTLISKVGLGLPLNNKHYQSRLLYLRFESE
jgi:hypothetical protein